MNKTLNPKLKTLNKLKTQNLKSKKIIFLSFEHLGFGFVQGLGFKV